MLIKVACGLGKYPVGYRYTNASQDQDLLSKHQLEFKPAKITGKLLLNLIKYDRGWVGKVNLQPLKA
jgi:hypothetical protein